MLKREGVWQWHLLPTHTEAQQRLVLASIKSRFLITFLSLTHMHRHKVCRNTHPSEEVVWSGVLLKEGEYDNLRELIALSVRKDDPHLIVFVPNKRGSKADEKQWQISLRIASTAMIPESRTRLRVTRVIPLHKYKLRLLKACTF